MITNAGFNVNIEGEISDEGKEIIVSQDPPAGSTADTGSIVTVSVEQEQEEQEQQGQ